MLKDQKISGDGEGGGGRSSSQAPMHFIVGPATDTVLAEEL